MYFILNLLILNPLTTFTEM